MWICNSYQGNKVLEAEMLYIYRDHLYSTSAFDYSSLYHIISAFNVPTLYTEDPLNKITLHLSWKTVLDATILSMSAFFLLAVMSGFWWWASLREYSPYDRFILMISNPFSLSVSEKKSIFTSIWLLSTSRSSSSKREYFTASDKNTTDRYAGAHFVWSMTWKVLLVIFILAPNHLDNCPHTYLNTRL